jgi:NhaA family Na+:H+ antiporter
MSSEDHAPSGPTPGEEQAHSAELQLPEAPPGAWLPARKAALALQRPLARFLHIEAASGILLLLMAVVAMAWANSPWREGYEHLWHTELGLHFGGWSFSRDLHFWINDGLMVIFFFVVGLEIRREMHGGELSNLRRAALPVFAALGGMLVPALIYLAVNRAPETRGGWGVPMATDIAFAVGVLALLGTRVPSALRVLLLALAIIDDIGAILVIAFFYSSGIAWGGLGIAGVGILLVLLLQRVGVLSPRMYIVPGVVLWWGLLEAGIHPTIAGVIFGLLTPARAWYGPRGFLSVAGRSLGDFERKSVESHGELLGPITALRDAGKRALAPAVRLEHALHPYVAFGIMPIFALSNAGVSLGAADVGAHAPVALGVAAGLLVGKPLGIVGACVLATSAGIAVLPRGVKLGGLFVVGAVAGIGFTMAIFIAQLAFKDPELLGVAKLAVLAGSLGAGVLGGVLGLLLLSKPKPGGVAEVTVDEAERSTVL